jgi:ABC-type sugar transport system substrate-binding protein
MDKQFKAVATKLHFKPTVVGTTSVSESADISFINEAVADGAKAILYTDLDPATFKSTVLKAEKAGVVMITIGAVDNISTYSVGTDNVAYAKKSVDVIAQKAGKNARVVLFATNLTVPNQAIQYHTFVSYAKQKYPKMQLLAEESDSADSGTAASDIRSVIEGYPNVNAFWMIEDASGPIIGKALQEAGKKPGQVFVLGIDALAGTLTEVQDGWVPELLNQCWFSSIPFDSELALGKIAGHGFKQQSISIPVQPVTKATLPYKGCPASYFPKVPGEPSVTA